MARNTCVSVVGLVDPQAALWFLVAPRSRIERPEIGYLSKRFNLAKCARDRTAFVSHAADFLSVFRWACQLLTRQQFCGDPLAVIGPRGFALYVARDVAEEVHRSVVSCGGGLRSNLSRAAGSEKGGGEWVQRFKR